MLDNLQTLLVLFSQQTSMVDVKVTWESQLAGELILGFGGRISAVWGGSRAGKSQAKP